MNYYNTNEESGETLKKSKRNSVTMSKLILGLFQANPNKDFTPDEVQILCKLKNYPITSCRRSITDLTSLGVLEKTSNKRTGRYGRKTFCWKLKDNQIKLEL